MLAIVKLAIPVLTKVIGLIAKGRNSKAITGGVGGAVTGAALPFVDIFYTAFIEGLTPSIEQFGILLGATVGGWLFNKALVWLFPANKET